MGKYNSRVESVIVWILTLISGAGVFLVACNMLSVNLEKLAGGRLKRLFKRRGNKLAGLGAGTLAAAAMQSSSAVSVMTISFVNAGALSLYQAAAVIFGANIGTTLTAQLVALGISGGAFKYVSAAFAAFSGVGALVTAFGKTKALKAAGGAISGFGMIFVGLSLMSSAAGYFAGLEGVKNAFASISHPALLLFFGAIFTAAVQSSSVTTSIAVTSLVAGLINLNQGVYITLGSNIGTCATALLAGTAGAQNGKRVALIHLIFNVAGVAVFCALGLILGFFNLNLGEALNIVIPAPPQLQLAFFHTAFNVISAIIFLPLLNKFVDITYRLVPQNQFKNPQIKNDKHKKDMV